MAQPGRNTPKPIPAGLFLCGVFTFGFIPAGVFRVLLKCEVLEHGWGGGPAPSSRARR